jgi:hypothetical protein
LPKIGLIKGGLFGEGILFPKNAILQSSRQFDQYRETNQNQNNNEGIGGAVFKPIFGDPIEKIKSFLVSYFNIFSKPLSYARKIERGILKFKDILGYVTLSVFFVILVEKVFAFTGFPGAFSAMEIGFPIFDEIFPIIAVVLANLLGTLVFHPLHRIFGGNGKFYMSFYVLLLTSIFSLTFNTILELIIFCFISQDPNLIESARSGAGGAVWTIMIAPMMAIIHKISIRRALFVWFAFFFFIFAIVIGVVFLSRLAA